jgi:prephenate dehydrogenase
LLATADNSTYKMKILILGAGKMGTFLTDALCLKHEVALFDTNPKRLRFVFNTLRMSDPEEIRAFEPELLINAATLKYTIDAFERVIPYLPKTCILSDIASVKTGLPEFYKKTGMRFVSTHPMFGPTFANLDNLNTQNAIIISESDEEGKAFFRSFYGSLKLNIFEYTFLEHDETIAYSLSIPFASTLVFASVMKKQEAPGTTFKKHMDIARGLLSEDDFLLSEILFNPFTPQQVENIREELAVLLEIIKEKDSDKMQDFLNQVRKNIE